MQSFTYNYNDPMTIYLHGCHGHHFSIIESLLESETTRLLYSNERVSVVVRCSKGGWERYVFWYIPKLDKQEVSLFCCESGKTERTSLLTLHLS